MPSLCSSNPYVIRAALEYAKNRDGFVLIEATANQVNQYGGYTGMKPNDFTAFVEAIADEAGCDKSRIILGGDHLGPVAFKDDPEKQAMEKAEAMVRAYVAAGFEKIHIDTSMRLGDDRTDKPLSVETIAVRAAQLCAAAEDASRKAFRRPSEIAYVVGSEVPVPGGTQNGETHLAITLPEDFERTLAAFKKAFESEGLSEAFGRIIAVVVQPGVEFGDDFVIAYDRKKAERITGCVKAYPNLVLEGHSTDYQTLPHLKQMAEDGIRFLKVGPELTFALREGLFALDHILRAMNRTTDFAEVLEKVMLKNPAWWEKYYRGTETEMKIKRQYSYSDRWRYYANESAVAKAIVRLFHRYDKSKPPVTLLSQFMPLQYRRLREVQIKGDAKSLVFDKVWEVLEKYDLAT